jgi:hypothetical protein
MPIQNIPPRETTITDEDYSRVVYEDTLTILNQTSDEFYEYEQEYCTTVLRSLAGTGADNPFPSSQYLTPLSAGLDMSSSSSTVRSSDHTIQIFDLDDDGQEVQQYDVEPEVVDIPDEMSEDMFFPSPSYESCAPSSQNRSERDSADAILRFLPEPYASFLYPPDTEAGNGDFIPVESTPVGKYLKQYPAFQWQMDMKDPDRAPFLLSWGLFS